MLLCWRQEDDECVCPHIGQVPHNEVLAEVGPSEVMNHPILAFDLAEGALFHLGVGSPQTRWVVEGAVASPMVARPATASVLVGTDLENVVQDRVQADFLLLEVTPVSLW